jgi:hypothetical protein
MTMTARSVLLVSSVLVASPPVHAVSPDVVISQVYGGGGNSGAPYANDFVELFNRGSAPVPLAGWSIQYTSATGTGNFGASATQITPLAGSLPPGAFLLIQEASNAAVGNPLPTPDVTDSTPINMSGTAGKVALVNTTTPLGCNGGSTPCSPVALATIVDLVGYGNANFFEGSGAAPTLSNTTAALRLGDGCTETDDNSADFSAAAPTPRNSASPAHVCGSTGPTGVGAANPGSGPAGTVTLLTVAATSGTGPTSPIVSVTADLSAIGGSSPQTFFDDGTNGDLVPNDDVFSFQATVGAVPAGAKSLPFTVTDALSRTGSGSIGFAVDPPLVTIPQIQGSGSRSPYAGQSVSTTGIVTGIKTAGGRGFFIQDPVGDGDPNTSDGVFVFTSAAPPPAAAIGNEVKVTGLVTEFVPGSDPVSPPLTEITGPTVVVLSTGQPLPAPVVLTSTEPDPAGSFDQLEKYEGMRVHVDALRVVGPTLGSVNEANATAASNGLFFGVIPDHPRPYREPGVEASSPLPPGSPCCVPIFDTNPERLRVDSFNQPGTSALDVATGAVVSGITGPLDFGGRTYSILVDGGPAPTVDASGAVTRVDAPIPLPDEVTIASANLQRFFDTANDPGTSDPVLTPTAFENRLNKASRLIRDVLKSPDILGVEEVENLTTLQAIAARVNHDAVAAGDADPGYTAYLEEGNDVGGIDSGFLVKGSRVTVSSVTQYGLDETYIDPATGLPFMVTCSPPDPNPCPDNLNDRPPLVLVGSVAHPTGSSAFAVTVIVNHLRSLSGIDADDGYRIRHKRKAQAEFLASLVQSLQNADPDARVVSVGDYNAFQFSDGYVDGIGTIKGSPTPPDEVVVASPDLLDPDLTNLTDAEPAPERYSYVFSGSAQELDHVLVNPAALASFTRLGHPRVNADFPEVLRNDPDSPVRSSDHDPVVAYFHFQADVSITTTAAPAPVLTGSAVTYTLSVGNAGPDAADQVVVSDTLPAGTTFHSAAAPADWSCTTPPPGSTGALTCHVASLARGATATLTLVVNVDCSVADGTAIANTATVHSAFDDPDPGNGASTTTVTASNPPPILTCPAPISVDASGSSGAMVMYPPAVASDNCPGVSVVCLPPSGSTFPIGVNLVHCTGTDSGGGSAACAFSITVNTPRAAKLEVLADLVALRATVTDRSDREKLDAAIRHLRKAVDPQLWRDDSHPDEEVGGRVFGEEEDAVSELRDLIRDPHSTVPDAVLLALINRMVGADRLIAQVALADAEARGGNPVRIARARDELTKGNLALSRGRFEDAIEHYRDAWKQALRA